MSDDRRVALVVTQPNGEDVRFDGLGGTFHLGSGGTCEARLEHPLMPACAGQVRRRDDGTFDLTVFLPGSRVDTARLALGERYVHRDWGFALRVVAGSGPAADLAAELDALVVMVHAATVESSRQVCFQAPTPADVAAIEDRARVVLRAAPEWRLAALRRHAAGRLIAAGADDVVLGAVGYGPDWRRPARLVPARESLLDALVRDALALAEGDRPSERLEALRQRFDPWFAARPLPPDDLDYLGQRYVARSVKDLAFGDGPLEDLLAAPALTEVMVVARRVYAEREGTLFDTGRRFPSEASVQRVVTRVASRAGRRLDLESPLADARLADGSRANAVLAPIAVDGSALTVRKFPASRLTLRDLVARGALTPGARRFLEAAVRARLNLVVSGGTGSGKTTLLNALADAIRSHERVVTIEDTTELRFAPDLHVVRLEARPANAEGKGAVTLQDLGRNALRMRPDRVVVGETRGAEAMTVIQAMTTGHDGSMTTLHANTPDEALDRLVNMAAMAGTLSADLLRPLAARAVNLVIQLRRDDTTGRRAVTAVAEVTGHGLPTRIGTKTLFAVDPATAELKPTGLVSAHAERLALAGWEARRMFDSEPGDLAG